MTTLTSNNGYTTKMRMYKIRLFDKVQNLVTSTFKCAINSKLNCLGENMIECTKVSSQMKKFHVLLTKYFTLR
jgi:hypothetical protein